MRAFGASFGNRLAASMVACAILWIGVAPPVSAESPSPPPPGSGTSPSPAPEATLSADETSAIAAYIKRGFEEAPTDFINVRGRERAFYSWDATVSFRPAFESCTVHHDTDTRNWGLQCQSINHAISSQDLSVALERAVNANLPPGFKFARGRMGQEYKLEWTGPKILIWAFLGDNPGGTSSYSIVFDHDLRAKWWEFWKR